jgi:hypothetical protein
MIPQRLRREHSTELATNGHQDGEDENRLQDRDRQPHSCSKAHYGSRAELSTQEKQQRDLTADQVTAGGCDRQEERCTRDWVSRYQVTTVNRRETATRPSSAPTVRAAGWEARPQSYKTVAPTNHVAYAAVSSKRDMRASRRQSDTTGAGGRERPLSQRRLTDRA